MLKTLKRLTRSFRDEDGNVTIEFVILFPALLTLTAATMDVSFFYYKKSQIHAAVQDFTRARSIGAYTQTDAAAKDLEARLAKGFSDEAHATMEIAKTGPLQGLLISTNVTVPLHDMQLVGFFSALIGDPAINIGDQQLIEKQDVSEADQDSAKSPVMVEGILQPAATTTTSTTTSTTSTTSTTIY